jgi:hypothetical protein
MARLGDGGVPDVLNEFAVEAGERFGGENGGVAFEVADPGKLGGDVVARVIPGAVDAKDALRGGRRWDDKVGGVFGVVEETDGRSGGQAEERECLAGELLDTAELVTRRECGESSGGDRSF